MNGAGYCSFAVVAGRIYCRNHKGDVVCVDVRAE